MVTRGRLAAASPSATGGACSRAPPLPRPPLPLAAGAAEVAPPFPFPGLRAGAPSPVQWPQPARPSGSLFLSDFFRSSSSCSSSKSSSCLPSTKAVRTRSRCSCASMESAFKTLSTSSTSCSARRARRASCSSATLEFCCFILSLSFFFALCFSLLVRGAAAPSSFAGSAADQGFSSEGACRWAAAALGPVPFLLAASCAGSAASQGFSCTGALGAAPVLLAAGATAPPGRPEARAFAFEPLPFSLADAAPALSAVGGGAVAAAFSAATPCTVSGPETAHPAVVSPFSNISSTSLRAASSSSAVNCFSVDCFSSLAPSASSPPSSSLPSSWPSRRRSMPSSSFSTSFASSLAASRFRMIA
mmetsp:Transcript_20347/g.58991  ORF Transcript_20347/g.58991 Transcript_20347/m.58991 type:complete len:360 (-) Transcript_20347:1284-2363(-)